MATDYEYQPPALVDLADHLAQARMATTRDYPDTVGELQELEAFLRRARSDPDQLKRFALGLQELLTELEGRRRDDGY